MSERRPDPDEPAPHQLHIWDPGTREVLIGDFDLDGAPWTLHVVMERTAPDLFGGRLSFRRGEERFDTATVIVEESEEDLVRRAAALPASVLRQFLVSVRD